MSEKTIIRAEYDCDFIKYAVRIYDGDDCDLTDDAMEWDHQAVFNQVKEEHKIELDADFYEIEDALIQGEVIENYDEKHWKTLHVMREKFAVEAIETMRNGHEDG